MCDVVCDLLHTACLKTVGVERFEIIAAFKGICKKTSVLAGNLTNRKGHTVVGCGLASCDVLLGGAFEWNRLILAIVQVREGAEGMNLNQIFGQVLGGLGFMGGGGGGPPVSRDVRECKRVRAYDALIFFIKTFVWRFVCVQKWDDIKKDSAVVALFGLALQSPF